MGARRDGCRVAWGAAGRAGRNKQHGRVLYLAAACMEWLEPSSMIRARIQRVLP